MFSVLRRFTTAAPTIDVFAGCTPTTEPTAGPFENSWTSLEKIGEPKWHLDGNLKVTSLMGPAVESVSLLGCDGELDSASDSDGLTVNAPPEKPGNHAVAFEILQ